MGQGDAVLVADVPGGLEGLADLPVGGQQARDGEELLLDVVEGAACARAGENGLDAQVVQGGDEVDGLDQRLRTMALSRSTTRPSTVPSKSLRASTALSSDSRPGSVKGPDSEWTATWWARARI